MSADTRTGRLAIPRAARSLTAPPQWLIVTTCYLALSLVFFWPALLSGAVPLPLTNPYTQGDPVWAGYAPADAAAGSNRLLGDVSGFYYPYMVFSIERLRAGDFPLWNPQIFGGVPYFAASQAALLYPINLLTFWAGPHHYWALAALLRLMIAGWGMFLLARRLSVGFGGALLAGVVYMFADFQVVWLHFAIHNVAALLPLALWLIARLAERSARGDTLALAALVAAQMFGGHPEMSLFFMVVCALFALVVTSMEERKPLRRRLGAQFGILLRRIAPPLALGLALAAVQWAPTAALIQGSYTLEERSFAAANGQDGDYSPLGGVQRASWGNLRHWLLLVTPELWGSPRGATLHNWLPERTNYNEMTPYVGLAALPLLALGLAFGRDRRAVSFAGALFFGGLLLLFPLPGLHRIGFLPLFDVAYGFRFGLAIALGAALLAGMGLDALLAHDMTARALRRAALLALTLAALSAALVGSLWGGAHAGWVLGFTPDAAARAQIAAVFQAENLRVLLPALAGLLLAATLLLRSRRAAGREAAALLAGTLVAGELLAHGFGYNGFTAPQAIYPATAAIAQMRSTPELYRALPLDGALWANSAMVHGVQVVSGMDDLKPGDQARFLERGMAGVVAAGDRVVMMPWGRRIMDLLNVEYVLARRPVAGGDDGAELPLTLRDGELYLYRNPTALPRAYAAFSATTATRRSAEDAVFAERFDPHSGVVLEQEVAGITGVAPQPNAPVQVVSYTPDRVELAADLSAPAVVVLADVYDADWEVTVNGAPAELLRANAMLRGVAAPAGASRIVFEYRPRIVLWSSMVSIVALVICGALAPLTARPAVVVRQPAPTRTL